MQPSNSRTSVTQTLGTTSLGARCLRSDSEQRVRLFIYGEMGAQVVTLYAGLPITIGRSAALGLSVADTSLSREHALFELKDGEVWVHDLGSTNGTRVAGERRESCKLAHGAEAVLGRVTVVVHVDPPRAPELADLVPAERFQQLLAAELTRSSLFDHALVLVRLEPERPTPFEVWYPELAKLLRPVDQVGFWRTAGIQIYLPEAKTRDALQILQSFLGASSTKFRVGIANYPEHAVSFDELTEKATHAQRGSSPGVVGLAQQFKPPRKEPPAPQSNSMRELLHKVDKIAPRDMTTLVEGETGSGKEVVARLIHERSSRKARPFETVNCGAIPPALLESALFGHERGAFTGADKQVSGVFERAHQGSVFLDEVAELSASAQTALLRVLETRAFTRVGGTQTIQVDVRVIAATHRKLEHMCHEGTFRRDLWFRLNTVTLELPPLRERRNDILLLAEYFCDTCAERERLRPKALSAATKELLLRYTWPGNVRELRNEMERALVLSDGNELEPADFSERLARPLGAARPTQNLLAPDAELQSSSAAADGAAASAGLELAAGLDFLHFRDLKAEVQRYEADLIRATLDRCRGNQTEAAKLLRMPRRTFVYKLKALGIATHD